jgi:branched-chain amino acid aminotransferase
MPVHAKATANYANSALARIEAIKAGFDEAILLNTAGKVVEASAENIFIVKNKTLITPPISSGSLEGITRDTVLALAKEDSILTEIRDISKDELYLADEIFLTGTAAEIKSVGEIDNRMIGNGKTGTITKRIKKLFEKAIRGNHKYSEKWLVYISNN